MKPLAILYEHPEWFEILFAELDRRGIPFERIRADQLIIDPESTAFPSLLVNRMSPSAWKRGHANAIFTARDYLTHLEHHHVPIVNGTAAYNVEISKVRQLDLFRQCAVSYPKARVINHASLAVAASHGLTYPIVVKPNIGGSGAGIVRFDRPEDLDGAPIDLGIDSTALVQEFLPARDGAIVRVEVLNGEFLYAIKIFPDFTSFNLCPADICQREESFEVCMADAPKKKQLRIEHTHPPREAIEGALKLARASHLNVGGIEYLVNDRTGEICYYDINALSNFVTDAVNVIGFDPTARFVDYLQDRMKVAGAA